MHIAVLKTEEKEKLEDFFALVFGEKFRKLANDMIDLMFSKELFKHTFVVGYEDEKIVAAASICPEIFTVDMWGISWVAVHPEYRNQGFGQKIVEACLETIASKIDCTSSAILATIEDQTQLYEKLGFSGSTKDHDGGYIMTKTVYPVKQ